ncbi:MAG: ATP-dependent helicase HrpB [Hyphomonadaceae bacterium]
MPATLPIDEVMPDVLAAFSGGSRVVISAPPGAGKTTRIPLALLDQSWTGGERILLVEPRRIAARAAAERMAQTLGERVGETVGVRSRLDVRVSSATRIEVVTEGVFTRMVLSDPALEGVCAVLFDEFHERSLDADEGLALALDAQAVLLKDLRIAIMSATLPESLTRDFFDAPVIASEGRAHPVENRYLGWDARTPLDRQMAAAIETALDETSGSVLAFFPGMGEIQRAASALRPRDNVLVCPLYGALTQAEQTAAIAPAPAGQRKVVLATDIAESSLTIEGVNVVVDCGFTRKPRFDPALGTTRLETRRAPIASAEQRRGRAGRTGPGVCYCLWREAEMAGFPKSAAPEIEQADLSGLCLDLARWGAKSPAELSFLTPPSPALWRAAADRLMRDGALAPDGTITDLGRRIVDLPLSPALARMVVLGAKSGAGLLAAETAAVLSERDAGGRSTDLDTRLRNLRAARGGRDKAMARLAQRWAKQAGDTGDGGSTSAAEVLATAFPERIARARKDTPGKLLLAGGRGVRLDEADPLARHDWLVIADLTGAGADLRVTLAAPTREAEALRLGGAETIESAHYDPATRSVRARRSVRLGAITVSETALPAPSIELVQKALLNAVREEGLSLFGDRAEALLALIARVSFLHRAIGEPWPADFASEILARLDDWLGPLLSGVRSLDNVSAGDLANAARALLDWPLPQELDSLAPSRWVTPAGSQVRIDYAAEGGPIAACKVQEVYGLRTHPTLANGRAPLILSLLSPALRPVATTRDLPSFWNGGYADMRKDMKGRYPKHEWPEDPASAAAMQRSIKGSSSRR